MRLYALFFSFLSLLPLSADGLRHRYASLLTPPLVYHCTHTTSPIVIDGKLNEADWQRAAHTAPFVDIQGKGKPLPLYPTTAQLLWDEENLYVAARIIEPNIVARLQQRDTIIWKENDFEVFLDPYGEGTHYYEFEVNARGTMMDLLMTQPYRTEGSFLIAWNCPELRYAIHQEGTLNQSHDVDSFWCVEMAIPIRSLRHNFDYQRGGTAGETWRLNFSRVQWLKPQGPEENWVWSPTGKIDIHMPERWGYLHFVHSESNISPSSSFTADYQLLWACFYAQLDYYQQYGSYASNLEILGVTASDLASIATESKLQLNACQSQFLLTLTQSDGSRYTLDQHGKCRYRKPESPLPSPL